MSSWPDWLHWADEELMRTAAALEKTTTQRDTLKAALADLVAAIAEERAAEDIYLRSGEEAYGMDLESAQATLIIRENAARAALVKADQ